MKSMSQIKELLTKINAQVETKLALSRDTEPESSYELYWKDKGRSVLYVSSKLDRIVPFLEGYLARLDGE